MEGVCNMRKLRRSVVTCEGAHLIGVLQFPVDHELLLQPCMRQSNKLIGQRRDAIC
jgi:hypothetical protein